MERKSRREQGIPIRAKAEQKYQGDWAYLPDLVLEEIFQYLGYKSKLAAALVCRQWSRIIFVRKVWSTLQIHDSALTMSRFNYAGKFYEEVLDHVKASRALHVLAPKLRKLTFEPRKNLHVICSFQQMMTKFCKVYG